MYKAFGLCIKSDLEFPELLNWDAAIVPLSDMIVEIHVGVMPDTLGMHSKHTHVHSDGLRLLLDIKSVARVFIQRNSIIYSPYPDSITDSLRLFLLGPCIAGVLQLHGYVVLHGNAISTDGKTCTAFLGHSGAGKSTTAAWYFQQGAKILTDDLCVITFNDQGKPLVIPSFPQLKIWQDAADLLGINTENLRQIHPAHKKFAIKTGAQFCQQPLPLQQIFELQEKNQCITQGIEKLTRLIHHSFNYYFLEYFKLSNQYGKLLLKLLNSTSLEGRNRNQVVQLLSSNIHSELV